MLRTKLGLLEHAGLIDVDDVEPEPALSVV
jgi:hypothetical protein